MPRKLTNKQLAVLHVLRERGHATAKQLAAELTGPMATCPDCGGSGKTDKPDAYDRYRCPDCFGRGERRMPYMDYGTAYQACERLAKAGLVERRDVLDEWGDSTGRIKYVAVEADPDPDDPLERAFSAPSAEVDR